MAASITANNQELVQPSMMAKVRAQINEQFVGALTETLNQRHAPIKSTSVDAAAEEVLSDLDGTFTIKENLLLEKILLLRVQAVSPRHFVFQVS